MKSELLDRAKTHPRAIEWGSPFIGAVIDYLHRGGRAEYQRQQKQAEVLRQAIAVIIEYREILDHNVIGMLGVNPGASWAALERLSLDLVDRAPVGLIARRDRPFYVFLGQHWRAARRDHPGIQQLRECTPQCLARKIWPRIQTS